MASSRHGQVKRNAPLDGDVEYLINNEVADKAGTYHPVLGLYATPATCPAGNCRQMAIFTADAPRFSPRRR